MAWIRLALVAEMGSAKRDASRLLCCLSRRTGSAGFQPLCEHSCRNESHVKHHRQQWPAAFRREQSRNDKSPDQ